ncbi:GvpL/GvpF family gas vesicle protein [Nocardioides marmoribigeumensis]|jgi:hypothetical protein|uniref:GvpL/GvpF family gas vesicle protein n=1 Tax=Nocardioides marmoribigeumensis TaxID=433649 RepID=A0ABU2BQ15_9ACTN|nr:GvpL/GvpF family gas vesicle protein [Nocardioides marmoribigeumensis]MDR7360725.1 hypothetical protein [Nocardioides marmoribigeumensis]
MSEPGAYLFAVARGLDPAVLAGSEGLRSAPLRVVEDGDLQAVVCDVDLTEFGEAALTAHLEDLAWVEEVARRHNDVVWQTAQQATTAPARLVTIFAGDASVARMLADHRTHLAASLDAVDGCQEWSLKVYAAPAPAEPAPTAPAAGSSGSGAAYLQRKKQAAEQRRHSGEQAAQLAEAAYRTLGEHAVAARRLAPQDPRLTGRREPMVLNAAFLVPVSDAEDFQAAVSGLDFRGGVVTAELAGPWPAYSFATLERA